MQSTTPPRSAPTNGDSNETIATFMALHDRDVRSAIRRVLGHSQEEDDLVQEVFVRLLIRLRQPGDVCAAAWLRGVAHNLAVDEVRRRRPVPVDDARLDAGIAGPADERLVGHELYSHLVEGAKALPDRQRAALAAALATDGNAGVAGVATTLGVSVHAAESLISRARTSLRKHLAGVRSETGGVGALLGTVLAVVGAAAAYLARHWRATSLATAVAAGAVTTAVSISPFPPAGTDVPRVPYGTVASTVTVAGPVEVTSGSSDPVAPADDEALTPGEAERGDIEPGAADTGPTAVEDVPVVPRSAAVGTVDVPATVGYVVDHVAEGVGVDVGSPAPMASCMPDLDLSALRLGNAGPGGSCRGL